jgi:hypothetical protein
VRLPTDGEQAIIDFNRELSEMRASLARQSAMVDRATADEKEATTMAEHAKSQAQYLQLNASRAIRKLATERVELQRIQKEISDKEAGTTK